MFKLALIHIRRYLKNPTLLLMMGPVPLFVILGSLLFSGSHRWDTTSNSAFVLETKGPYELELLQSLNVSDEQIYLVNPSEAINRLQKNELAGVFLIPSTFSTDLEQGKKPTIDVLKTAEGIGTAETELKIEQLINHWLKEYYQLDQTSPISTTIEYIERPADMIVTLFIFMLIYFIFIGAGTLAHDVSTLKKQKVLHRALSTANKDIEIFGGLVLAMCLIQGICFTIVYYIGMLLLDISLANPLLPLLLMFSMSFVATSLVVFVTRIMKNPNLIQLVIMMYALVGFFLSLITTSLMDVGLEASILSNLAKLFPIYWAFDTALNFELWPNIPIILLFGFALLSAGSFKLKNFIQN